jgi:hypothetical protein
MSTVIQSPPPVAQVATPAVAPQVVQPVVAPSPVITQPAVAPAVVTPAIAPAVVTPTIAPAVPSLSPSTASALGVPITTNPQEDYLNNLLAVNPSSSSYTISSNWSSGLSSGWSFSSLFSFSWIGALGYIMRVGILFGLIFLFTSIIPQQELELNTRLLIAGTVVLFYALLDVFRQVFGHLWL